MTTGLKTAVARAAVVVYVGVVPPLPPPLSPRASWPPLLPPATPGGGCSASGSISYGEKTQRSPIAVQSLPRQEFVRA